MNLRFELAEFTGRRHGAKAGRGMPGEELDSVEIGPCASATNLLPTRYNERSAQPENGPSPLLPDRRAAVFSGDFQIWEEAGGPRPAWERTGVRRALTRPCTNVSTCRCGDGKRS